MKSKILVLLITSVLLISSCNFIVPKEENNSVSGTTIVLDNDQYYFFDLSSVDKSNTGLFVMNKQTKEREEIANFKFFSDIYLIDHKIYYAGANDTDRFSVYSYDGKTVVNEGEIPEDLMLVSGDKINRKEFKIFIADNVIVAYNNKIYLKENDKFIVKKDDIVSITWDNQYVYYSNTNGDLLVHDGNVEKVLLDKENISGLGFVKNTLGGDYVIKNLAINGDFLCFLIAEESCGLGKIYRLSLKNNKLERLVEVGGIHDFIISNSRMYYYDIGLRKFMYKTMDNEDVILDLPLNIHKFDIYNGIVYYTIIDREHNKPIYYSYDGENRDILF